MRFRILTLLAFMSLCWIPLIANAATYNWHFSNNSNGNVEGNDTTGNGSVSRPWKTLSKAQAQINILGSSDTANLYFDRGDTWFISTGQVLFNFLVDTDDPEVNIDAYGDKNKWPKPLFDGLISDFSTAKKAGDNGYIRYSRIFQFNKNNCSISNVEIKNVYGNAIYLRGGDYFTLSNSEIHDIGRSAITVAGGWGAENNTVEYNKIYRCFELDRNGKVGSGMWGGGISFFDPKPGSPQTVRDNHVRYNLIYDIYGEGINNANGIVEYNVVGDTGSIGIDLSPTGNNAYNSIVRYNFLIFSDRSGNEYDAMRGSGPHGIRIFDEQAGGDNIAGNIEIYGNIIINRLCGILQFCNDGGDEECGNPFGTVKIYNNMIIDSRMWNLRIANPGEVNAGYVYNNASIRYDTNYAHTNNSSHTNWTFSHNAFYPVDGSNTVGTGWTNNYVSGNPKLPGEPSVNWDGLTGPNYFHKIKFDDHLYLPSNSSLTKARGKSLERKFLGLDNDNEFKFLTNGTDFSKFVFKTISPTKIERKSRSETLKWFIGPISRDPTQVGGLGLK